ncbi:MAG: Coenzyme F420 hydrogenase/dehydrogenase, beta subunit C-terminal domain [Chloroflexi bacterium]|nr:Coenzyme F420 hydrogenase/dehydrogenase, beta subunit C-terminal domain [Chloroflexota bacterium]
MKRFESLRDIVENGYCMSCGLCTGCAPDGVIQMRWSNNGHLRPRTTRDLTIKEEDAIVRICPGINQTGPFNAPLVRGNHVWGELRRVAMSWASDPNVRFRSSTGGVIAAINRYLLESGRVSFILQVRASASNAFESDSVFIHDPDELQTGSQSRYASSAPLTAIHAALEFGEPFAVSLKPCDIAGIRNLQREDERARRLIVFTQSLICGSVPTLEDTLNVLRRAGLDPDREPPKTLQWRGDGCPGPIVATMPDGREVTTTYQDMYYDNPTHTQFRCKICPDSVGLQADIATGDSWPNAEPKGESEGTNVVVAHTEIGIEVLAECERLGYLEVRDAEDRVLDDTQPHQTRLRRSFAARLAGAIVGGTPTPNFTSLAEDTCAAELEPNDLADVFRGSLERVRAGQADESSAMDDWDAIRKTL